MTFASRTSKVIELVDGKPHSLESGQALPSNYRLNIQILGRCIGTALNLGSPLKIGVYYASKDPHCHTSV